VVDPPACAMPVDLVVNNITSATAEISWTPISDETEWEIIYGPVGFDLETEGTSVIDNDGSVGITLTGLNPATDYEVYIKAICSPTDESNLSGPIAFSTACDVISLPWVEDFAADSTPTCWEEGGDNAWDYSTAAGYAATDVLDHTPGGGTNYAWMDGSDNSDGEISTLTSPFIDVSSLTTPALSFALFSNNTDDSAINIIEVEFYDGTSWNSILNVGTLLGDSWQEYIINVSSYSITGPARVRFTVTGSTNGSAFYNDILIDDVSFMELPTCPKPINLVTENATSTSVDVSWTPNGSETEWEIIYGPVGFDPETEGTSVIDNNGTAGITLTGLNPATDYDVYVKAVCSPTDESNLTGPIAFSTECDVISLPWSEDFATDTTPTCWEEGGDNTWDYSTGAGYAATDVLDHTPGGGTNYAWMDGSDNVSGEISTLTSPFIDVSSLTVPALEFYLFSNNTDDGAINIVDVEIYNGTAWNDILNINTLQGDNWQGFTIDISSYNITGPVRVRFTVTGSANGSAYYNDILIDDVTFIEMPDCIDPIVDFDIVSDCDNSPQFFIEGEVTDIGGSDPIEISDDQGSPMQTLTAEGTFTFGPYPNGTEVFITVENTSDVNCSTISTGLVQNYCPPSNDECIAAIEVTPNDDSNCTNVTAGTIQGGTASAEPNTCSGTANDDVWFQFTATTTDHIISILNISDSNTLYHSVYEGVDCDNLSLLYCADGFGDESSIANNLTVGETYWVRVYTSDSAPDQNTNFDICVASLTPPIIVDTNTYTIDQLVTDVLINNPCAQVSNITAVTGTDFGDVNGIGYFDYNNSSFPLESGVVLNSGDVTEVPGPETGIQSSGGSSWPGDPDLTALIQQIEGNTTSDSNNATIIEFDFVPFINEISFDFLFASDEYGTFQCSYSDSFAFFLTDSNGNTTNLAVVPGTSDPVSVLTIRDDAYNSSCSSQNEQYFANYYGAGGLSEFAAPIDFKGHTTVLTAQSAVTPGEQYHIKLVIGDRNDTSYNSAVFLQAGSFDIGGIDLGDDITLENGNINCQGDPITLDTGITNTTDAQIDWYFDGNLISGENGPTLEVTEEGNYTVSVIYFGQCGLTDQIDVNFIDPLEVDLGNDTSVCNGLITLDGTPTNAGMFGNATYTWYQDGTEIAGETSATLDVTEEGTYTVEVDAVILDTDGNPTSSTCFATDEVIVDSSAFTVDLGGDQNFCSTDSYVIEATLTGAAPSDATFEWSDSDGVIVGET
ncbi:choice-of-anchor L domain-containing protein, partial [Haloflavibacter putidus]